MAIILSESHIRSVVAEAFKISSQGGGGSSFSVTAAEGLPGEHANFKYVEIPDPDAAEAAKAEEAWWKKRKETDPSVWDRIKKYWGATKEAASEAKASAQQKSGAPWSAAFISSVKSDTFFNSSAHNTWKEKAENNTAAVNADPASFIGKELYIALPIEGTELTIGDNIWRPRSPKGSHSDIVISKSEAIGGNLSDTVKKTAIKHQLVIKKVKILGAGGGSGEEKQDSSVSQSKSGTNQVTQVIKKGKMSVKVGDGEAELNRYIIAFSDNKKKTVLTSGSDDAMYVRTSAGVDLSKNFRKVTDTNEKKTISDSIKSA